MKSVDYVASQERKRRIMMICSSWPPTEKPKRKRSLVRGVVKKPIGNNVATTKKRVLKRMSKNDSVLHKHVKWLKQLQEERRLLDENIKEAEQKQQEERNKLFMEREAKKRASGKISNTVDESKRHTVAPSTPDTDDSTVASSLASSKSDNTKRKKPAWCQSEAARDEAEELNELDDEVNLLDFVSGLDFDQYNEDLELQTLMCQVKERINKLERESKKDETKLQTCIDSENAAQRAEALENGPVVDFVPADIVHDEVEVDDTKSIANSVMSESTIGSIHSKKSLTALVSKARERKSGMSPIVEEDESEKAMPPPVLSTVTDDNGARMAEKKSINKLAFKNRNPAL